MLKEIRIPIVDFETPETGQVIPLVAPNFRKAVHKDHMSCHTPDCPARMEGQEEKLINGSNSTRQAFFKTVKNSSHIDGCQFDPEYTGSLSFSIADLVHINVQDLLFEINFSTSFSLEGAKEHALSNHDALETVSAKVREAWLDKHFSIARRGADSTEKLLSLIEAFRDAKAEYPRSQTAAKFSFLNAVQNYSVFRQSGAFENFDQSITISTLVNQMQHTANKSRIWNSTPHLRQKAELSANAIRQASDFLLMKNATGWLSGQEKQRYYERIAFSKTEDSQEAKRQLLSHAGQFSFTATPYISVQATQNNLGKKAVFLDYAIGNPAQIALG